MLKLRTIAFIMVLAGLLAWGVTSLAHSPMMNRVSSNATVLQGHELTNAQEVDLNQIQPIAH
jgi:hypothetical protein